MPRMMKKVYAWTANISVAERARLGEQPWIRQAHACVAAESMAAVCRLMGTTRGQLFNLGETWNGETVDACMQQPGVVLLQSMGGGVRKPFVLSDRALRSKEGS